MFMSLKINLRSTRCQVFLYSLGLRNDAVVMDPKGSMCVSVSACVFVCVAEKTEIKKSDSPQLSCHIGLKGKAYLFN